MPVSTPAPTTARDRNVYGGTPINRISELAARGAPYPPLREGSRIRQMERFYRYSRGDLDQLIPGKELRLAPNLFADVMDFWVEAIVSESPVVTYDGNDRVTEFIEAISPAINEAANNVIGDVIRYGVGCFINQVPMIPQSIDPRYWYPVRSPFDNSEIVAEIVAYPYIMDPNSGSPDHIRIMVFQGDTVNVSLHQLDGMVVSNQIDSVDRPCAAVTERQSLAVVPVTLGTGIYGRSQFLDIEQYVAELSERESRIAQALDKLANPHLAIHEAAIRVDEQGNAIVDLEGMMIPIPDGADVAPQYVTWELNTEAHQEAIKRAEQRIQQLTKINRVLVDPDASGGQLPSGSALRRLAITTVNRIRRIRQKMTEAYKDVIVGAADLYGKTGGEIITIERDAIQLQWPPELSAGIIDESDAITVLVQSGILDHATATQLVMQSNRKKAEQVAEEAEQNAEPHPPQEQEANDGQNQ